MHHFTTRRIFVRLLTGWSLRHLLPPHFHSSPSSCQNVESDELAQVEMSSEIKALDSDMQMLVYENYNKFISATDTIRSMKCSVEEMDSKMLTLKNLIGGPIHLRQLLVPWMAASSVWEIPYHTSFGC